MKVKKLRLRGYVVYSLFFILASIIAFSGYKIYETLKIKDTKIETTNYVNKNYKSNILPTISEPQTIIKPYNDERVGIKISFYNINDSDINQQNSLIYYENIYMPSTGIMYTSTEVFNALAIYDGVVKDIKEDEVMGKIVTIEHENNLISEYLSLSEVNVSVGQKINQGEVVGVSGKNKIVDEYALDFQVYKDGKLINPSDIYNKTISEINE